MTPNPPLGSPIRTLRQQRVILDADLARLYGVPTKRLNEQVHRDAERFPVDFMFRLTFAKWRPDLRDAAMIRVRGSTYHAVKGPFTKFVASGPAEYYFDASGNFLDWTRDSGDSSFPRLLHSTEAERILTIIAELVEISEYSREFPVCLWAYGDTSTFEFLSERLASLPSPQQMEQVLQLPHMTRHERDRLPYRYSDDKIALRRYRNELADYNRRCKLAAKNEQRARTTA